MNTEANYDRHRQLRTPETATTQPLEHHGPVSEIEVATVDLQGHDPSPEDPSTGSAAAARSNLIAWVRPTKLASYAGPALRRVVDTQAALILPEPGSTSRATQHHAPEPVVPAPLPTRQEGPQL